MTLLETIEKSSFWFPYSLGLAAAGLLPVKSPRAYRAVSLALALLWSWLVLASGGSNPVWTLLAALEALLFLVFGALLGKIEFRVRDGFWVVVGTSFLVYSLLVFPLLGRVFEIVEFERSVFNTPVPMVLLTCGILFFAVEPRAAIAFAVPLVWALSGGPEDFSGAVESSSLQVALLAGALFLALPSEVRQGSNRQPAPGLTYRVAHRYRAVFGYGLWVLILVTVFLFFVLPAARVWPFTLNLALLCALGMILWLAYPAWQSFWYRSVAWWLARVCGRLWWGTRQYAWRWGILALAAMALWTYLPPKAGAVPAGDQSLWDRFRTGEWPLRLFVMALFLWVAFHAYRGRKRLVIGTFSGHGDEALDKGLAAGLGTRLQSELARIADVYKVIDDASPSPRRLVIEVTPGVLEVGEILKDASAMTLGPLKIPANFLVELVGLIVSGPRLTGVLHKVGDRFILTAEISGGGFNYNWQVDYDDLSKEEARLPPGDVVQKLVEQLAFRVATDLVSTGSPRWRAVRCYTDGLRFYREAQRQQRNKKSKLRDSERSLIQALNDDQRFTQCHFNLGVVYGQLGEHGSAQAAFRRVLTEEPGHFDACYALAEALVVNDKKYREGIWFCEAALRIKSDDPRPWALEAFACLNHHVKLTEDEEEPRPSPGASPTPSDWGKVAPPGSHPSWKEVREASEIAVALAWRALCRRALAGPPTELRREKDRAFLCTRNLAVVLSRSHRFKESRKVFRQAAWLVPHDPRLRLYEGRTLIWDHSIEDAAKVLEGVFADGMSDSDRGLLWSILSQVHARTGPVEKRREEVRLAHNRFLDAASGVSVKELREFAKLSLEPPPDEALPEGRV